MEEFEKILDAETDSLKGYTDSLQNAAKMTMEPLQTFETKVAVHTKNNEQILK